MSPVDSLQLPEYTKFIQCVDNFSRRTLRPQLFAVLLAPRSAFQACHWFAYGVWRLKHESLRLQVVELLEPADAQAWLRYGAFGFAPKLPEAPLAATTKLLNSAVDAARALWSAGWRGVVAVGSDTFLHLTASFDSAPTAAQQLLLDGLREDFHGRADLSEGGWLCALSTLARVGLAGSSTCLHVSSGSMRAA